MTSDNELTRLIGISPVCSEKCWIEIEFRDEENNTISGLTGSLRTRCGLDRQVILHAGKNLITDVTCGPVSLIFMRNTLLYKTMNLPMRDKGVASAVPDYAKSEPGYKNVQCSYRLVKYVDFQDPKKINSNSLPPEQQLDLVTNQSYVLELRATRHEIIAVAGTQCKTNPNDRLIFFAHAIRMLRKTTGLIIPPHYHPSASTKITNRTSQGGLPPGACVCTLLFFSQGYTDAEKALLKDSVERINKGLAANGTSKGAPVVVLLELSSFADFIKHLESGYDRSQYLVGQLNFYAHGLDGRMAFGYKLNDDLNITMKNSAQLPAYAFSPLAHIESYACRTGIGVGMIEEDVTPDHRELSLGQRLADVTRAPVLAYVRKTDYCDTWAPDEDRHSYYLCPQSDWADWAKGTLKFAKKRDAKWCARYKQLDAERKNNANDNKAVWNKDGASGDVRVSTTTFLNFTSEQITLRPR